MEFVIVSGLSGAGKSSVINILEDRGFYCVDNMPIALLSKCAELWVFGPEASEGMQAEINYAVSRNKRIRYFTKDCKEVTPCRVP